ncbi:MAG TPA: hypothetical protein VM598_07030 [Bdellovibrionota bacterium]|nr:hypothetical protein [Bdellovibrionota bacterium]
MANEKDGHEQARPRLVVAPDHQAVTRRQFIGQGLLSSAGYFMAPSLMTLLAREAFGACPTPGADPGYLPFMVIDCAGGAGLSGNFVVGGQAGAQDYLTSYNTLGIPSGLSPSLAGSVDTQFGAPLWNGAGQNVAGVPANGVSQIRAGMLSVMGAQAIGGTSIITICNSSQDDTETNPLSPLIIVSKAGYRGGIITAGIGTTSGPAGGNSTTPLFHSTLTPTFVSGVNTIANTLSFGGAIRGFSSAQKTALTKALLSLNTAQATQLQAMSQGDQLKELTNCAYTANQLYAPGVGNIVDARLNAVMQSVYGITATSNNTNAIRASITYNVLANNTGPGCITIGGCDYHGNDRVTVTDPKDFEIGRELGRVLEAAARMGKAVVVAGITDGAVVSDTTPNAAGFMQWSGDSGGRSLAFMACYKPTGKPTILKSQIGYYTSGQVADRASFFGNNPAQVSYVILANYLRLCGKDPAQVIPNVISAGTFNTAQLPNVLGFG